MSLIKDCQGCAGDQFSILQLFVSFPRQIDYLTHSDEYCIFVFQFDDRGKSTYYAGSIGCSCDGAEDISPPEVPQSTPSLKIMTYCCGPGGPKEKLGLAKQKKPRFNRNHNKLEKNLRNYEDFCLFSSSHLDTEIKPVNVIQILFRCKTQNFIWCNVKYLS